MLKRALSAAACSPSGSNPQPWHAYVLTSRPLTEPTKRADERLAAADPGDKRDYEMYPPALKSPYRQRRSAFGEQRYSALRISREDVQARQRTAAANWDRFGAPTALFSYPDHDLGPPQRSDAGTYPQMAWSAYRKTLTEVLSPPDKLILFCGTPIGHDDATLDYTRTGRTPLNKTVTFVEG